MTAQGHARVICTWGNGVKTLTVGDSISEKGESTISFLTKLQKDTDYIADCTVVAVSLAYVLLPFDFVQFFILGANPAIDIVELC